jgi:hypothetical protein
VALEPGDKKPTDDPKKDEKLSAQDEVLMREIDEAVRKDEMTDFADRYGKPLIAGVAAIILGFGGYLWWDGQNEAAHEKASEDLVGVIDQAEAGNLDSADKAAAALASSNKEGQGAAAKMLRAGIAAEQEKGAEAAKMFKEVSSDAATPPALRDLARIRAVTANFDERKPEDVVAELKDLAVPGNPWFGSAGELVAMAHLEAGDKDKAGELFAAISKDEDVPTSIRSRARQMSGMLGVDAIDDVDELLEEQGIPTASQAKEAIEKAGEEAGE